MLHPRNRVCFINPDWVQNQINPKSNDISLLISGKKNRYTAQSGDEYKCLLNVFFTRIKTQRKEKGRKSSMHLPLFTKLAIYSLHFPNKASLSLNRTIHSKTNIYQIFPDLQSGPLLRQNETHLDNLSEIIWQTLVLECTFPLTSSIR